MDNDESLDPEATALLAELEATADLIKVEEAALRDRYARRLVVFRRLIDKSVTQARIARAARVTPMAVSYALNVDQRKAAPVKRKPAKRNARRSA